MTADADGLAVEGATRLVGAPGADPACKVEGTDHSGTDSLTLPVTHLSRAAGPLYCRRLLVKRQSFFARVKG